MSHSFFTTGIINAISIAAGTSERAHSFSLFLANGALLVSHSTHSSVVFLAPSFWKVQTGRFLGAAANTFTLPTVDLVRHFALVPRILFACPFPSRLAAQNARVNFPVSHGKLFGRQSDRGSDSQRDTLFGSDRRSVWCVGSVSIGFSKRSDDDVCHCWSSGTALSVVSLRRLENCIRVVRFHG